MSRRQTKRLVLLGAVLGVIAPFVQASPAPRPAR